ncbi:MAG TPA: ABC transporter ATP-binding protein [Gemmataceae bacterium]|nr:ABC transporter ATP-binding protein [Gemmataceae bacterium]
MERKAFARAWRFLGYHPAAKWSAMIAAVGTGILYVAFLVVLGLFADLMVNRGKIPAYRDLPRLDRESFHRTWSALAADQRKETLLAIGLGRREADRLGKIDDPGQAPHKEQELLWRAHIYWLLDRRVNASAAALVLLGYDALTANAQQEFRRDWQRLSRDDQRQRLSAVGADESKVGALAKADVSKFSPPDQALLWRAHLERLLTDQAGSAAASAYRNDRVRGGIAAVGPETAFDSELNDRGVLSLVVRTEHQLYGPGVGWLARWSPWMWRYGSPSGQNYYSYLSGLLTVALVLALLRAAAMFTMNYAAALATIEASNRLRRAIYHHTFRLGTLAFRALGPSEAVGIFTRQLEAVHDGLFTWLTVVCREPVKFGLLLLFAVAVDWRLALPFLLAALLVWLVGGQIAVYLRRQERVATRRAAEQLALLQESLMLMRLVKVYLMELFNQSRVERQLATYAGAQMRRYRGQAIAAPLLIFLGTLAAVVLLFVAGLIVLSGSLGVAGAITLATALISLYWPLVDWLEHRRFLRRGRESAVALFKFLDRPGEVGQVVGAEFLPPLSKQLEFDRVSLLEPGTGRKLLDSVSLTIQAGQRVALVGPDDMEKHALVYLLPRFLDPNAGEIRIDKHNLRWVTFDSLRAQTAIVLQHNLVFNDTVANNIGCGDQSYDLPKIIEAAKVAHAHHFIQKLPQGYETPIGEMGHYLGISEQFRIALARAILRDAALMIIEEPVAALDDDTKALLDDTFARVLPGRTVIFLPHRISTIRSCDQVFLLHKGHVEAAGEHRTLLSQNQLYRHLQYLEFNEFAEQAPSPVTSNK